ncbi:MAG TPA: peptidoglycan editing factor PgeF [Myxococcota bacterium]|nr:peptidoglycan editing factor PgeF [Myxococcota bacterium]
MSTSVPASWLSADALAALPAVHAFTSREGGASGGAFATCNLSFRVGDARAAVERNRAAVLAALDREDARLVAVKQVHGAAVVEVTALASQHIEADALWTRDRRAVLAVLVADCLPVLMADREGRVVAAVHAGWRGTEARIVRHTVERLLSVAGVAPESLMVALGPAIGPCCFEIGEEVGEALRVAYPDPGDSLVPGAPGKLMADLWALNTRALVEAGVPVAHITALRRCTRCTQDWFSHRRDAGVTGRQAGVIALRAQPNI